MRFDIITIFPKAFDSYLSESILKRARQKKLVGVHIHNLRTFTKDKRKTVDDRPFGGGPGMILKIEPIIKAVESIFKAKHKTQNTKHKVKIILLSASGKQFDAKMAVEFAKRYSNIILIAGHYEGIDARIKPALRALNCKLEEISIGPYVLTGGELPAMVVLDAISRHIHGVLGKAESLEEKRHGIGVPAYTRPEVIVWKGKKYRVPKVLLSGDHKKIEEWRKHHKKMAQ